MIEIKVEHLLLDRPGISATLGIPEVWHLRGDSVELLLHAGEAYRPSTTSAAFPALAAEALSRFVVDSRRLRRT